MGGEGGGAARGGMAYSVYGYDKSLLSHLTYRKLTPSLYRQTTGQGCCQGCGAYEQQCCSCGYGGRYVRIYRCGRGVGGRWSFANRTSSTANTPHHLSLPSLSTISLHHLSPPSLSTISLHLLSPPSLSTFSLHLLCAGGREFRKLGSFPPATEWIGKRSHPTRRSSSHASP